MQSFSSLFYLVVRPVKQVQVFKQALAVDLLLLHGNVDPGERGHSLVVGVRHLPEVAPADVPAEPQDVLHVALDVGRDPGQL